MIFRVQLENLHSRKKSSVHFKLGSFTKFPYLCMQARWVQLKLSISSCLTHVICKRSFVYSDWPWYEVTEDALLEIKARVNLRNIPMPIRDNCGIITIAVMCRAVQGSNNEVSVFATTKVTCWSTQLAAHAHTYENSRVHAWDLQNFPASLLTYVVSHPVSFGNDNILKTSLCNRDRRQVSWQVT